MRFLAPLLVAVFLLPLTAGARDNADLLSLPDQIGALQQRIRELELRVAELEQEVARLENQKGKPSVSDSRPKVPAGMRVSTIVVTPEVRLSRLQPGDHVTVMGVTHGHGKWSQLLLTTVKVLSVERVSSPDGSNRVPRSVSLAVTHEQELKVERADKQGQQMQLFIVTDSAQISR